MSTGTLPIHFIYLFSFCCNSIGRTGRVGKTGVATSFFNNQDTSLAADLVQVLKEVDQQVAPWLAACAQEQVGGRSRYKFTDARRGGGGGGGGHSGRGDGGYGGSSGGAGMILERKKNFFFA